MYSLLLFIRTVIKEPNFPSLTKPKYVVFYSYELIGLNYLKLQKGRREKTTDFYQA